MNPNKRQRISSSRSLRILHPVQINNNVVLDKEAVLNKRPPSSPLKEMPRVLLFDSKLATPTFVNPKQTLQEIYEKVSLKMEDTKYKLTPSYTIVKLKGNFKTWCCTYKLKWPETAQFKKTAPTKKKAAAEAALEVLLWLRQNGNITENGEPVFAYEENVEVLELYDEPQQVLHNTYDGISRKLKEQKLRIKPVYDVIQKPDSTEWSCTYSLKWPELKEIKEVGSTKREASEEAALSALLWLKNNEKITERGRPILDTAKETTSLTLHPAISANIRKIVKEYEQSFLPKSIKTEAILEENTTSFNEVEEFVLDKKVKQRFLGHNKYLARERTPLPITQYKEQIMDLVSNNRVVVIKGEAGCGKSTRVPQYVLEAWIKETKAQREPFRIAVTQPRRIAAISLAERVSFERDEECGLVVGYQIRLNKKFNPSTGRILYCTSGILLRHLQSNPALENFSSVILDEAHEREANTDLLMCLLKNSLRLNSKLKLVVMSATIDTELFKNYFDGAPVLVIGGFVYPVQEHFLEDLSSVNLEKTKTMCQTSLPAVVHSDVVRVITHIHTTRREGAILCFLPGWDDICRVQSLLPSAGNLTVFCLHSKLQDSDQWKIFQLPRSGERKVILATNIAETSVTIDDVVYVIDTGVRKESRYDFEQGVLCLDNEWISRASVIQRKGRAGRVGPGESFHLFTRSRHDQMSEFSDPEILKMSLTKIVLDSIAFYGGKGACEFMSQLPTPPQEVAVKEALRELKELTLLDHEENLTPLGKILAHFQLEPKLAKTLVHAAIFECVTPVLDIVTIFSSEVGIFSNVLADKHLMRELKSKTGFETSDHLSMMMLFEFWLEQLEEHNERKAKTFCQETSLNHSNLLTLLDLRTINFGYLNKGLFNSFPITDTYSDNFELVKAVLFSGLGKFLRSKKHHNKHSFMTSNNHEATITSESVNFKPTAIPTDYLIHISEIKSKVRKTSIIRECSAVPILAILLFSSQELTVNKINSEKVSLGLKGTSISYSCSNRDATDIRSCKKALNAFCQYNITRLSENRPYDQEIKKVWDTILLCINEIFLKL